MDNSHWINFFTLDNVKKIHIDIFEFLSMSQWQKMVKIFIKSTKIDNQISKIPELVWKNFIYHVIVRFLFKIIH